MEFRLTYEGPLPSNGNPDVKHEIRRSLHHQLAELWATHPRLKDITETASRSSAGFSYQQDAHRARTTFNQNERHFLPLVRKDFAIGCSLDILFLRRDHVGNLIKRGAGGGDIDNRLKTFFDALQLPDANVRLSTALDPNPFYVLLENDDLISDVRVSSDRLLAPALDGRINDVRLMVGVRTIVLDPGKLFALTTFS